MKQLSAISHQQSAHTGRSRNCDTNVELGTPLFLKGPCRPFFNRHFRLVNRRNIGKHKAVDIQSNGPAGSTTWKEDRRMTSSQKLWLAVVGVVVFASVGAAEPKPEPPVELEKLIPADAEFVLVVNLRQALDSTYAKQFGPMNDFGVILAFGGDDARAVLMPD